MIHKECQTLHLDPAKWVAKPFPAKPEARFCPKCGRWMGNVVARPK